MCVTARACVCVCACARACHAERKGDRGKGGRGVRARRERSDCAGEDLERANFSQLLSRIHLGVETNVSASPRGLSMRHAGGCACAGYACASAHHRRRHVADGLRGVLQPMHFGAAAIRASAQRRRKLCCAQFQSVFVPECVCSTHRPRQPPRPSRARWSSARGHAMAGGITWLHPHDAHFIRLGRACGLRQFAHACFFGVGGSVVRQRHTART